MANDPLGLAGLPKVKVPAAETPRPEALLGLATGVVVVSALYFARDVLIPITLAIFLSFFLAPIVKLLQRARLPKVVAVILTGMGQDGVAGLRVVKERGGYVLGQDEASSVVYGMPRAAAVAGLVDRVVALDVVARTLCELAGWAPV